MQQLGRYGVFTFMLSLVVSLSGCRAIEGIFKAGFWSAILIALVVFALAFAAIRLFRRTAR
jgi:hypothetical protein